MSLNFDLSAIPEDVRTIIADADCPNQFYVPGKSDPEREFDYRKGDRIMNPVTNALIWATLGVGIGKLTEDNLAEFAFRMKVTDGLYGKPLQEKQEDGSWKARSFTLDELKAHVGLSTNVSFEKRVSWITRLGNAQVRDIEYALKEKAKAAAKAA
jgi:hypothetical protein